MNYKKFIDKIITEKSNFKIGINDELLYDMVEKMDLKHQKEKDAFISKAQANNKINRQKLINLAINTSLKNLSKDDFEKEVASYITVLNNNEFESTIIDKNYNFYNILAEIIVIKDHLAERKHNLKQLAPTLINQIRVAEIRNENKKLNARIRSIRKSYGSEYITYIIVRNREVSK